MVDGLGREVGEVRDLLIVDEELESTLESFRTATVAI
jgi:hypothetical protein